MCVVLACASVAFVVGEAFKSPRARSRSPSYNSSGERLIGVVRFSYLCCSMGCP